jgi:predicted phosphoribosyltransferase
VYKDRLHAGEKLAERLQGYTQEKPVLLAVPRGGIIVAKPVADRLDLPIYVLITRKIGHPKNPEVAIGALMPDGSAILDDSLIQQTHVSENEIEQIIREEASELDRRMELYAPGRSMPDVKNKTAMIIDDGIATGYTLKAAVKWLKTLQPRRIVVAVPVGPPDVAAELATLADEVICLLQPDPFWAVGLFFEQFPQSGDEEVLSILRETNRHSGVSL